LEALLCLIGVALGVAVVVGIDSAVAACVRSFQGAVESLAERSTHSIFAEEGKIADETFIKLVREKLPYPMAPVIDRSVLIATSGDGVVARLMGVDVFSERSLRSFTQLNSSLDAAAVRRFLTEPGQVVLVDALAERLKVKPGDAVRLTVGKERVDAQVLEIVKPGGVAQSQLADVMIADLATAQELTGTVGFIDRIDVKLESEEQERVLNTALPKGLVLRSTGRQSSSLEELIQAYKLNLNALSLMASFVAVFIVYNSMLISVQQRAKSLGILRCLGASRAQLGATYLAEALIFAVVGGLIGVIGGWILSKGMVGLVATTINDLYATVRPGAVTLNAGAFLKGLVLSTLSCLVGAAVPLYRASRAQPVNAFRSTARADASRRAAKCLMAIGVALLVSSWGLYLLPTGSPVVGFAMALWIALGFALVCPWAATVACGLIERASKPAQVLPLRMAASGVRRSLGITGVAIAATMLAMAMNVGVRTMVSSFRGALGRWVEQRFAADVFVGPELLVNHKIDATLDPRVETWVLQQSEVQQVGEHRAQSVHFAGKSIMLTGTDAGDLLATGALPIKHLASGRAFNPVTDAMISEPLAGRTKLGVGDTLEMGSPTGPKRFFIYAIFYDFGSERGQVMLDRHTYAAGWRDDEINSLHVQLKPGVDPEALAARWSGQLRGDYPVVVNSFAHVKGEIMKVFDRTFKVTEVLTWLAGGVAFCGLAGSLLSISLARQRDYSVLAAIGMSGRQTAIWMLGQGIIIAWTSALVAAAAGTSLAYVLAYVIQFRSFGWSIPTRPSPRFWVESLLLATVAAVVAAIYPAYRLRAAPPAGSLREE
jgi:putative ABC transport system permease protein